MAKTTFNFKESATKATTLSDLMNGREKIETDALIKKFPDGFTVIGADMVNITDATYPVLIIKEDTNIFYTGGIVLKKIVEGWMTAFDSIEAMNAELEAGGGVKMKLTEGKTKSNQNLTTVTIL